MGHIIIEYGACMTNLERTENRLTYMRTISEREYRDSLLKCLVEIARNLAVIADNCRTTMGDKTDDYTF